MHSLLILFGMGLIVGGLVWLGVLAFGTSLLWGVASLVPGLNLVYALRHWRRARKALTLSALGVIPLVVGLTVLASKDVEHLQALLSLHWMAPEVSPAIDQRLSLVGQVDGQAFVPTRAELIDGVLSLREGDEFFARREVRIYLGQQPNGAVHLNILPEDTGKLPLVEISWRLADQPLPQARRLSHGYSLSLDLVVQAPNKLVGSLHLGLPANLQTLVSGDLELFTNRLRYRDGQVDRHIDSRDTLAYVVTDYLERRFRSADVQLQALPAISFPARHLELPVIATIHGHVQALVVALDKPDAIGWNVAQDHFPALSSAPLLSAPQLPVIAAPAPAVEPVTPAPTLAQAGEDRRLGFSLQSLQANPGRYRNLSIRAVTDSGASAEGRFTGLDDQGHLIIQGIRNGLGGASFNLLPSAIVEIQLLEP